MTHPRTAPAVFTSIALLAVAVALLVAVLAVTSGPAALLLVAAGLTTWLTAVSTRGL